MAPFLDRLLVLTAPPCLPCCWSSTALAVSVAMVTKVPLWPGGSSQVQCVRVCAVTLHCRQFPLHRLCARQHAQSTATQRLTPRGPDRRLGDCLAFTKTPPRAGKSSVGLQWGGSKARRQGVRRRRMNLPCMVRSWGTVVYWGREKLRMMLDTLQAASSMWPLSARMTYLPLLSYLVVPCDN